MSKKLLKQTFLRGIRQQERPEYEKPSVTVDMVLMCYNKEEEQLKIALIQRKGHPFRNSWALPGGFVKKNESTGESVIRETKEETGSLSPNKTSNNCTHSAPLIVIRVGG